MIFFLRFYIFTVERGERKEKNRKRNMDVRETTFHCPDGGLNPCNPGMCPGRK